VRTIGHIALRELAAMVRSPVAIVVAVAFLVVQGLSFTAVVAALSDPRRPGPLGAVLEGHFGGGLLHWTVQIAVVSLLAMRTIAESRRAGTWEVLITAPVGEGAAVVGAWLGAVLFYALLWIPTLAYLIVLQVYAPAGASFDPGPIAAAYLGELIVGASFLAVGVAASAATANQIVAGVATFAALLVLLMLGEVGDLAPGAESAVSRAVSVRGHLAGFARGEIALAPVVFHAGLAVTALSAAATLARAGRRARSDVAARAVATALAGVIAVLAVVIAVRHPRELDVTAARQHTLAAETRAVLARVDAPVALTILRPTAAVFDPIYPVVERAAARMARTQPFLTVDRVDPARAPERAAEIARLAGTPDAMIERSGAVVVARGDRRRVVLLADLADYRLDAHGQPTVARLSAEEALAEALAAVLDDDPARVCATSGHGELALAPRDDHFDVAVAADRLRRDGIAVEDVGTVAAGVPAGCDVVAVLGPRAPLGAAEAGAIAEHVQRGGGLLVAAASREAPGGGLAATGLEPLLTRHGLEIVPALVIDSAEALELPLSFRVGTGYGHHPAVRGFAEWRPTAWQIVRPVRVHPTAGVEQVPLVSTSPRAFATRDLAGASETETPTDPDLLGPLHVAVWARADGGAVVALGSAESLSSVTALARVGAGDVLLASLLAELAGRARPDLALPDRTPAQVRLVMTRGERSAVFALCVVVLPLGFAVTGTAAALWRRRRRS
jgi:ABC-2 type transport system permease protein